MTNPCSQKPITVNLHQAGDTGNTGSPIIPDALIMNTSPDGASVLIDDVYRGSTPLIIERIKPGTYRVAFSRFGYTILSTPVRVESGKTTKVSGALIPFTGSLDITTCPQGPGFCSILLIWV
jgi:hypothetical protein